jgi:16S rRNA A1518/A1519 N6-dimethyltransferase RsmA/KsgA/DIM1 with predicted DNA glycosylase/AP lyase activity
MATVQRYRWDTPEYADAFSTLLKATGERAYVHKALRALTARHPPTAAAADWGAGGGDLTRIMLERFRTVYAVEPNPAMRAALAARCPEARVLPGNIK